MDDLFERGSRAELVREKRIVSRAEAQKGEEWGLEEKRDSRRGAEAQRRRGAEAQRG